MRSTKVVEGRATCPKCGASDFTDKRTVKGKIMLGIMAPKRLICRGCGAALKKS